MVEDSADDAELVRLELERGGFDPAVRRVSTAEALRQALAEGSWDLVLSDYTLPTLAAPEALEIVREAGLDLPFIIVSGSVSEDIAVASMRAGAHDFFAKARLARLGAAVERELREAQLRRERREALDALRRVEAHHRLIVESVRDHAIFMTDAEGRIVSWNSGAARLTGYLVEDVLGKPLATLDSPDAPAGTGAAELLARARRDGTSDVAGWRATRGGARFWAETHVSAVHDETQRGFVVVVRDAGEKRRADLAMRLLVEASKTLASSLGYAETLHHASSLALGELADWCAVWLLGDEGRVELGAFAHRSTDDLARLSDLVASSPPSYDTVVAGRSELSGPIDPARRDALATDPIQRAVLHALDLTSRIRAPLSTSDQPIGIIELGVAGGRRVHDARDLALAEELGRRAASAIENARLFELAQRERARVEDATRAKDEFIATISHELRTPLSAVLGWARMLRSGGLDAEKRERAIETIERNARAQSQLIEDLVDVSRVVSGRVRLQVVDVDLVALVTSALDTIRPTAELKGIHLSAGLDPRAGGVSVDPDRMLQVISNLLTNAVKFTPRGGHIEVELTASAGSSVLTISDSGQGIPPRELRHVFDRFWQADQGARGRQGGLGLGLSIVKHLVDLHGGTVEAFSEGLGRGARFTVTLPLVHGIDRRRELEVWRAENIDCPQELVDLRVLVVDDDDDARDLLETVLAHCRAIPVAVGSAADAYRAILERVPDLVVSDISMPVEDGYQLMRRVRALPPSRGGKVPALALTSHARVEDRTRALLAGFDAHVPKPVDPSELVASLRRLAGRLQQS